MMIIYQVMTPEMSMMMCEMCDSIEGIRREDNIHVCDSCDKEFPIIEQENEQ